MFKNTGTSSPDLCFSLISIWHILWLKRGSRYACDMHMLRVYACGGICWNKMCLTINPKSFDDNKVLKIDNWYC